ncbi:MAG: 3'-5' exonuclease KapD [Sporomusaceae bacterium]|nr:3'-5' exonuclease KapD [Sporomusaceae bacterium]
MMSLPTLEWRQRNLLVADFEFTTFSGSYGRPRAFFPEIIEAGAILLTPPAYAYSNPYQVFVKPRFFPRLTEECRNITLIKQQDVDGGISFEDMLTALLAYYKPGATFFAAWGNADRDVIQNACTRYKLTCPFDWNDYIDLAEEYKAFYQLERRHSLKHALEERCIEQKGLSHLALDDAINAAQVMLRMIEEGWVPGRRGQTE